MIISATECVTAVRLSKNRSCRVTFVGLLLLSTITCVGFHMKLNNTTLSLHIVDTLDQSEVRTASPFLNKTRNNSCSGCFSHDFRLLINNKNVCKHYEGNKKVELLLLIFSKASRVAERYAIRRTWASASYNNTANVRHVFLLGKSRDGKATGHMRYESRILGDIVQEDFIDSYNNLTYKTIMGFKWASEFCQQARFVMKVDDDVLINIPRLLAVLNLSRAALQTSVGGFCRQSREPIRSNVSKWYISNETYPDTKYPPYCIGPGYVTSMHVAKKVVEVSKDIPFLFLEDVYVGLCLAKLGFNITNIRGFNYPRWHFDPCLPSSARVLMVHFSGKTLPFLPYLYNKKCQRNYFLAHQKSQQRISA